MRIVTTSSIISTLIGWDATSYSGEYVSPTACGLNYPTFVTLDPTTGDIYLTVVQTPRILLYSKFSNMMTTFAGSGIVSSSSTTSAIGDEGAATSATFNTPDGSGFKNSFFLVADEFNYRIRKVVNLSPTGAPTIKPTLSPSFSPTIQPTVNALTIIGSALGNGVASSTGSGGTSTSATVNAPRSVFADSNGNVYIAECSGNCVRRVINNLIYNYAGVCGSSSSFGGDGGQATSANFNSPVGINMDTSGVVYIADSLNNRARSVSSSGIISTVFGTGTYVTTGNGGPATSASVKTPIDVWVTSTGKIYVSCYNENSVRSVVSGVVTLIAG